MVKVKQESNYLLLCKVCEQENEINLNKWNRVKHELLNKILEKNAGCLITDSKFTFTHNNIPSSSTIKIDSSTRRTFVLPHEHWSRDELEKVATSGQFEIGEIWMIPDMTSTSAAMITALEVETFWKFAYDLDSVDSNFDKLNVQFQAIGCLSDGNLIVWTNPSPEKIDSVVENLKKLCLELQVEVGLL